MNRNDLAVLTAAELSPEAAGWSKTFDRLIIVIAAFLVLAVTYINFLLLAGDWDFFIDFKDREYWPVIYPIVQIMQAASFQAIFWYLFRLPIGATASAVLFTLAVWAERYQSWEGLAYFPITLVAPGTFIAGAIIMDATLCITRSWLITAIFGGTLFGLTFYPSNWAFFAPYFQPVKLMDSVTSLASYIGYTFPRTGTPEYVRLIERGTLRTFGSPIWISVIFSSFICIFQYMIWWFIGVLACKATSSVPVGERFKSIYGMQERAAATAESTQVKGAVKAAGGVA